MIEKKIAFRFDIDSHKCLSVGVPNLLRLAKTKAVKFSFLVHCGRAIDLRESIKAIRKETQEQPRGPQLSARRKLGNWHFLWCALVNPELSSSYSYILEQMRDDGHEIGLHGGRNHELWARHVGEWNQSQIHDEIQWGLDRLRHLGIEPEIFGSPGAVSTPNTLMALRQFENFQFISDQLEPHRFFSDKLFPEIPVSICGKGGIAFVEQQIALGHSVEQGCLHFREHLHQFPLQVVYDHPYLAGDEGLPMTAAIVETALNEGFQFTSMKDIGNHLALHRPRQTAVP